MSIVVSDLETSEKFYDELLTHLGFKKVTVLYGGSKGYPEYHKGYYAVFFEDPDRVKLELMWMDTPVN